MAPCLAAAHTGGRWPRSWTWPKTPISTSARNAEGNCSAFRISRGNVEDRRISLVMLGANSHCVSGLGASRRTGPSGNGRSTASSRRAGGSTRRLRVEPSPEVETHVPLVPSKRKGPTAKLKRFLSSPTSRPDVSGVATVSKSATATITRKVPRTALIHHLELTPATRKKPPMSKQGTPTQ